MSAAVYTHVITVERIDEWLRCRAMGRRDAWEIWGALDRTKCTPAPGLAWTYWTTDPTVVDTCELARARRVPVSIEWAAGEPGAVITGCELWEP